VNRCPRVPVERPLGRPNRETSFMRIAIIQGHPDPAGGQYGHAVPAFWSALGRKAG
jgi:hypothetical protein